LQLEIEFFFLLTAAPFLFPDMIFDPMVFDPMSN
jgi:hypothetical protein